VVQQLRQELNRIDYLDFACGTGRILAYMEDKVDCAIGIDVSNAMLKLASRRLHSAKLVQVDITSDETNSERQYDLISCFRFVLNAEANLREAAMGQLALRLRGPKARLVLNVHGNLWSYKLISMPYRWIRAVLSGSRPAGYMTNKEVIRLLEQTGLEVEHIFGFGFLSGKILRIVPWSTALWVERKLWDVGLVQAFGVDQVFVCRLRSDP
jgi:SAM-dependent methyltransferase